MNDQVTKIVSDVSKNNPEVTAVRLVYKKLGPIEAQMLADALIYNTHVQLLRLDSNKLGDRGAQILAGALIHNTSVKELNLASNLIHDEGACAIADMLKKNQTLITLKLNHNLMGLPGTVAIAEALRINKTLKQINLSCRAMPLQGVMALAKSLTKNNSLTSLHLSSVKLGTKGAGSIAEALSVNTSLRVLNLSDCAVTKEGVGLIVQAIKTNMKNTQLKSIDLSHNQLPPELLSKIEKLLEAIAKLRKKSISSTSPDNSATISRTNSNEQQKNILPTIGNLKWTSNTSLLEKDTALPKMEKKGSFTSLFTSTHKKPHVQTINVKPQTNTVSSTMQPVSKGKQEISSRTPTTTSSDWSNSDWSNSESEHEQYVDNISPRDGLRSEPTLDDLETIMLDR